MRLCVIIAALLQVGLCSHVAVRMPYLNPAGVTYVNSLQTQDEAFAYDTPLHAVETSLQYSAPVIPAKVEAHHVGYATAQVPAVAAVPYVKHLPTVSHVPVTTIEAQPGLLQKQLDVVKPAVKSRKIEVSVFRKWVRNIACWDVRHGNRLQNVYSLRSHYAQRVLINFESTLRRMAYTECFIFLNTSLEYKAL